MSRQNHHPISHPTRNPKAVRAYSAFTQDESTYLLFPAAHSIVQLTSPLTWKQTIRNVVYGSFAVSRFEGIASMAFMQAYIDESGVNQQIEVAAGAFAENEVWLSIQDSWNFALSAMGIDEFHASDFNNSAGKFKGWDNDHKKSLSMQLVSIIKSAKVNFVGFGILARDYQKVLEYIPDFKTTPYTVLLEMCVRSLMQWTNANNSVDGMAINIEAGQSWRSEAIKAFLGFNDNDLIKQFSFSQKKGVMPFQVADFIAYELYRHGNNLLQETAKKRPPRKSIEEALDGKILLGKICSLEETYHWINWRRQCDIEIADQVRARRQNRPK